MTHAIATALRLAVRPIWVPLTNKRADGAKIPSRRFPGEFPTLRSRDIWSIREEPRRVAAATRSATPQVSYYSSGSRSQSVCTAD
jgi:hypothetical protein